MDAVVRTALDTHVALLAPVLAPAVTHLVRGRVGGWGQVRVSVALLASVCIRPSWCAPASRA